VVGRSLIGRFSGSNFKNFNILETIHTNLNKQIQLLGSERPEEDGGVRNGHTLHSNNHLPKTPNQKKSKKIIMKSPFAHQQILKEKFTNIL